MKKPIFVDWCPKDALDGMQLLDPWEELAYRRLLDLIYATDDQLPDDDKRLAWMTKTGNRWKQVKASLIEQGKISVETDGSRTPGARKPSQKSTRKSLRKVKRENHRLRHARR